MTQGTWAGLSRLMGRLFFALALVLLPAAAHGDPGRGDDAEVRAIIQRALDQALEEQVKFLFATWMRDTAGQPQRASAGIRRAVTAYRHAIRAIETEKLTWRQPR